MIPYGRQEISEADIAAVTDVLRSDYLTQGPVIPAFEAAMASHCGAKHAIAVNSATSALHIACLALGVGPGDRVWTSPISFVASANCALYCGAIVDFVDIDPLTYNLDPRALALRLIQAEASGSLPKVVIPVHLCGQPSAMAEIHTLAVRYGFKIIEDASHAVGAKYRGEPVGNAMFSDIVVFSFHPVKIITTGEGGLALTNDSSIASQLQLLRSHGITRDAALMSHDPDGPWYYEQIALGYNYRITDIQAALGLSQLGRLTEFVKRRNAIAKRYDERLSGVPLVLPKLLPDCYSSYHLYVVRVPPGGPLGNHKAVFEALRARGIGVNLHYIPIYLQPYFKCLGFSRGHCPQAERYYDEAISLPIYPALSEDDQETVIRSIRSCLSHART